jgi:hypothetical protein
MNGIQKSQRLRRLALQSNQRLRVRSLSQYPKPHLQTWRSRTLKRRTDAVTMIWKPRLAAIAPKATSGLDGAGSVVDMWMAMGRSAPRGATPRLGRRSTLSLRSKAL